VTTLAAGRSAPRARSELRSVAMPTEHGGWGLTAEPALAGLALTPSWAGLALALAAMVAFVARTPLKVILVERHRGRHTTRARLARRVLTVELAVLVGLATTATLIGDPRWWWPVPLAAALAGVELWFDTRSRSRRLAPELAGSMAIAASAAAVVLAGGGDRWVALGVWSLLAGRAFTSIPHVRGQIARLHQRPVDPIPLAAGDGAAVVAAALATAAHDGLLAGALSLVTVVVVQRILATRPLPPVKVLGLRQMGLGLFVVAATAIGFHLT
jgi:hypothetical protein